MVLRETLKIWAGPSHTRSANNAHRGCVNAPQLKSLLAVKTVAQESSTVPGSVDLTVVGYIWKSACHKLRQTKTREFRDRHFPMSVCCRQFQVGKRGRSRVPSVLFVIELQTRDFIFLHKLQEIAWFISFCLILCSKVSTQYTIKKLFHTVDKRYAIVPNALLCYISCQYIEKHKERQSNMRPNWIVGETLYALGFSLFSYIHRFHNVWSWKFYLVFESIDHLCKRVDNSRSHAVIKQLRHIEALLYR